MKLLEEYQVAQRITSEFGEPTCKNGWTGTKGSCVGEAQPKLRLQTNGGFKAAPTGHEVLRPQPLE